MDGVFGTGGRWEGGRGFFGRIWGVWRGGTVGWLVQYLGRDAVGRGCCGDSCCLICLIFEGGKKRAMYRSSDWKDLFSKKKKKEKKKELINHRNRTTKMLKLLSLASHAPKQLATLYPNTKALTSMLSLGLAPSGLLGSTNAVCGTRAPFSES
jgi:hypothetical protein